MPETKMGTCPWCGRTNQTLFFTTIHDTEDLWVDFICARCRQEAIQAAQMITERTEPSE